MKILIIPSWFATDANLTAGNFFVDYIDILSAEHEVGIIFPNLTDIRSVLINKRFSLAICPKRYKDRFYSNSSVMIPRFHMFNMIIFNILARKMYKEYVRNHGKPDIIHALSCYWGGTAARTLSIAYDVPYYITEHSSVIGRELVRGRARKFMIDAFKEARNCSAVSSTLLQDVNQMASTEWSTVIGNPVSEFFVPNVIDRIAVPKVLKLCMVANLNKNKQVELAIAGIIFARSRGIDCELTIVGDGNEYKPLSDMVADASAGSYVKLMGKKSREEISEIMKCHDAYIITSAIETFSISTLEAVSTGLPVIASDCGGPSDFLSSDSAIVVKNVTPENIFKAILELQSKYYNYKEFAVEKSKEVRMQFSKNNILELTNQFYSGFGK